MTAHCFKNTVEISYTSKTAFFTYFGNTYIFISNQITGLLKSEHIYKCLKVCRKTTVKQYGKVVILIT